MMIAKRNQPQPPFMQGVKGSLLINEPMALHTTWKVGGEAKYFFTPSDRQDLITLMSQLPADLDIYWVGLGSNLLVRDGGVDGMVIRSSKGLKHYEVIDGSMLYAESGVACAQVARIAAANQLSGVEFLSGVPGSFGGALAMNAGAFGAETWPWVESVDCIDRSGNVTQVPAYSVNYGYRSVDLPQDQWVLGGTLKLNRESDDYRGRDKIRSLLEKRSSSQPIQSANAGSVFRNPQGDFAARLIERAGLKGHRVGGAEISQVHANFIVNDGRATASDIEALIGIARQSVQEQFGVELETEVRFLGRHP